MLKYPRISRPFAFVLAAALSACGGGSGVASVVAPTANPTTGTPGGTTAAAAYACPTASTSSGPLDCTKLPLGDLKVSTSAQVGSIYACSAPHGTPPVVSAPWLGATTWNMIAKVVVEGSVAWPGQFSATLVNGGATRDVSGNGLPLAPVVTGAFPIAASDPAHQYDGNPNSIGAQSVNYAFSANPAIAAVPTCLSGGPIGITLTGVAVFDAFDGAGYDAVAREEQDACHGHPDQSSTYHYHGILQACVPDAGSATQNSSLLGYARDGFGIYGPWYGGKILTTADLDACHGTTSPVMWDGSLVSIYHYVSTYEFPYTLGCYRGTPQ